MFKMKDDTEPDSGDAIPVALIDSDGDLWIRDKDGTVVVFYGGSIDITMTSEQFDEAVFTARKIYFPGDDMHLYVI